MSESQSGEHEHLPGWQQTQYVPILVSWAEWHHTLSSLKAATSVAVWGTIAEIERVNASKRSPHWRLMVDSTDYLLAVHEVIWDPDRLVETSGIRLRQSGGIWESVCSEIEEDPLFQLGEDVVLFLHAWAPGHYMVTGGPTGRFTVRDGLVIPMTDHGIPIEGLLPVAEFIARVRAA